jgi:hypothetical protein
MENTLTKEQIIKMINNSEKFDFETEGGKASRVSFLHNGIGIHFTKVEENRNYSIIDEKAEEIENNRINELKKYLTYDNYFLSKDLFKEVYEEKRMEEFKKLIN